MKRLFAVSLALIAFTGVFAQNNDMNKEVEVTKEYMPDVNRATKLFIAPRMIDTVTLRPDIEYAIRPMPWLGSFGVAAIKPIRVQSAEFNPATPFYIKAGVGFPLNSVLDFYATGGNGKTNYYGVALNHSGDYSKIKNEAGQRLDATKTNNHIGVFGAYNNSKRFWVGGEIGFDYDLYTPYAGFILKPNGNNAEVRVLTNDAITKKYSTPTFNIWLGNDFRDMSRFNIRGYVDGYYFGAGNKIGEMGIATGVKLGKTFNKVHTVLFDAGIENYKGLDNASHLNNFIATISPSYTLSLPKFTLRLGADLAVDNQKGGESKVRVYPNAELTLNLINEYIIPFITANGRVVNNGIRSTAMQNPYAMLGTAWKNTSECNLRGGISGTIAPQFAYKLYIGASFIRDYAPYAFFTYYVAGESSTANYEIPTLLVPTVNIAVLGAELNGKLGAGFDYWFSANYYNNSVKDVDYSAKVWLPNYDAALGVNYNYNDKFRAKVGAKLIGKRDGVNQYTIIDSQFGGGESISGYEIYSVDPIFDINAALEMQVSKRTAVFLEAHNIGASKLYYYPHCPSVGITCTAGVKLCF